MSISNDGEKKCYLEALKFKRIIAALFFLGVIEQ